MTLEPEIVDHLLKVYESNERLSKQVDSTQRAIASTRQILDVIRNLLDEFIKDELRRRREGHR